MEPIRKDLINQCTLGPVRGVERGRDTAQLPQVTGFHIGVISLPEQAETADCSMHPEIIEIQCRGRQSKTAAENMISTTGFFQRQFDGPGRRMVLVKQFTGQKFCLNRYRYMDMKGTGLLRDQGAKRCFEFSLTAVEQDSHGSLLWEIVGACHGILYTIFREKKSPKRNTPRNYRGVSNIKISSSQRELQSKPWGGCRWGRPQEPWCPQ